MRDHVLVIRAATARDGEALQAIERAAGARFRDIGMHEVAAHEPASVAVLAGYAADGRSWVAVDASDEPIGYVLVDRVDGLTHVEQLSVLPAHHGRGVGRALIEHVIARHGAPVTLTTFRDVEWNQPLYDHLGFRVMADAEIGPELRSLVAAEAAHGLDPATRVCMRFDGPAP